MKQILYALIFLFYSSTASATIAVSGKVINPLDSVVQLHVQSPRIGEDKIKYETMLGPGNTFKFVVDIDAPTTADLFYKDIGFPVFLTPGKDFSLSLQVQGPKQGKVSFFGPGGVDNTFYLEYSNFLVLGLKARKLSSLKKSKSKEFKQYVQHRKNQQIQFIKSFIKENDVELGIPMLRWVKNDIDYEAADLLLKYPQLYHLANDRLKNKDLPKKYYKFLETVRLNNEVAMKQPLYQSFIQSYFFQYRILKANDWLSLQSYDRQYDFAKKFFIGTPLHFIRYIILKEAISDNPEYVEDEYRHYIVSEAPIHLKENLKRLYTNVTAPLKGIEISPVVFRDLNGRPMDEDFFRNRVSYIFFWSRYSERSHFELRHARNLARKFENEDKVNVLFISTDADVPNLKKYIYNSSTALNDPKLQHLVLDSEYSEAFRKDFKLKELPQFFLIDPSGRIVSEQTWPPSSGGAVRVIRRLLEDSYAAKQ